MRTNLFALATIQTAFPQFYASWLKLLLPAQAHSISLLQPLNRSRWERDFPTHTHTHFKAKKSTVTTSAQCWLSLSAWEGSPRGDRGAALPPGLSQAAKRWRGWQRAADCQAWVHPALTGKEGASFLRPSGDCGAAVAQSELGTGIRAGRAAKAAALPN